MNPKILLAGLLLAAAAIASLAPAWSADLPGSKDPPFLKRYEGSEIVGYRTRAFDKYTMSRESLFKKTEDVEGAITRLTYHVPGAHTGLELLRNYEHALGEAGFAVTYEYEQPDHDWSVLFLRSFVGQIGDGDPPFWLCDSSRYATATATKDNQDLTVAVLICESKNGGTWKKADLKSPLVVKPGENLIWVDVVTAKAVEIKMVEVKAADIADALATTGAVDLYGIYFDVDKAVVRPESDKTLDVVASLLKIDRSLKLEIAGHTDSTGDKEHNLKLSQDRAAAVVDALVKKYSIDPARLQAQGYGDSKPVAGNDTEEGRAKNRRVELKRL
jgi:OmpA-OmpF porin, OOP family